jgi:hypothetical protein
LALRAGFGGGLRNSSKETQTWKRSLYASSLKEASSRVLACSYLDGFRAGDDGDGSSHEQAPIVSASNGFLEALPIVSSTDMRTPREKPALWSLLREVNRLERGTTRG